MFYIDTIAHLNETILVNNVTVESRLNADGNALQLIRNVT